MVVVRLRAALRQRMYPREFRIPQPAWPKDVLNIPPTPPPSPPRESAFAALGRVIRDVGTSLFTVEKQLKEIQDKVKEAQATSGEEEVRFIGRKTTVALAYAETARNALAREGAEIIDHTESPYNEGDGFEVLGFEKRPELDGPTVIETNTPTIRLKGELLQKGKVYVGKP